jgi:hypothetical protein
MTDRLRVSVARKPAQAHAGTAFSDMHIALAQVVAGNDAALEARARQLDELARQAVVPCVPAVSRAFAAFERRDFAAAIDGLEPITGELEPTGGSRAQSSTCGIRAVEGLSQRGSPGRCAPELSVWRPGLSGIPVAWLAAVH